ncbi:hypothetical protein FE257_008290 [Aspergillus nanangensis]|uniref:Sm protein B n=1 Tax=Aspergillus nanangensis TaxID=2582783 RepID=A0AAD4GTJ8_ASPNN|nr:hypothetical protein FE257_008290 [Aspergillus nanangensis]
MAANKQGKMQNLINYRMRVTLNDGRQMTGQMLAFDKHMNLVLADTEEFRRVKRKSKPAAGPANAPLVESEEKRTLGLTIVRALPAPLPLLSPLALELANPLDVVFQLALEARLPVLEALPRLPVVSQVSPLVVSQERLLRASLAAEVPQEDLLALPRPPDLRLKVVLRDLSNLLPDSSPPVRDGVSLPLALEAGDLSVALRTGVMVY